MAAASPSRAAISKTYVVEHLDPELGDWSRLEYSAIARETAEGGSVFCLSSLPTGFEIPDELRQAGQHRFVPTARSIEQLVQPQPRPEPQDQDLPVLDKNRVCLLDPKADADLAPGDAELFDAFLFGGILGDDPPRGP